MAKRHPSLVPVSRDHHEGLLLAVRLQQGENALLKLWSHDTAWQARAVVDFYQEHLVRHFAVEEEKVFPTAQQSVAEAAPIVTKLLEQHEWFRSTAPAMKGREEAVTRDELVTFGQRLEEHIRIEDRELFPLMEEHIEPSVLEKLEKDVQEYYPH